MNENDFVVNSFDSQSDNLVSEIVDSLPSYEEISDEENSDVEISDEEISDEEISDEEISDEEISDEEISDEKSEEVPTSTVIQVIPDSNEEGDYTITELDVNSLNTVIQANSEQILLSVSPSSNDYYAFISDDILEYFQDYMALYPLNDYKACHLRHYVSNTSYNTYYDDYYYLWYDYPKNNCIEIYKAYNSSTYRVTDTVQSDLSATIVYGSSQGEADFRRGDTYVQEISILISICVCLVLYILHSIFKHLAR